MDNLLSMASFILLYGVSYGLVLFIISIGLVITMGLMRVANLAHGVFAAAGGYLAFTLMSAYSLSFGIAAILAVAVISLLSVGVERVFFVKLYKSPEIDQILMTIGLCFMAVGAFTLIFGPNLLPTRLPASLEGNVPLLGRNFPVYRLFVLVIGVVIIFALWFIFDRTNFGAQLRAAVDNRTMAQATGINVNRLFSVTFAIGAGLAALGGIIGAAMLPIDPLYPFFYLPLFLIIVVLSGFGNIKSSLAVAIIVGVIDTAGRFLMPELGGFTIYVLLIGLLLWRPEGLLARRA
jgi:branched-chain amino acid transport system permease protein